MEEKNTHEKKHHHGEDSAKRDGKHDALIRCLAQEIYVRRGGAPGYELQDWLEAERQVMNKGMMKGSHCDRG
jgi:hypothetical protein